MNSSKMLLLILILITALWSLPLHAEWSHDPSENTPVCTATEDQSTHESISDGAGGMITAWTDERAGDNETVYVQRLDDGGNPVWSVDGVSVTTSTGFQHFPQIVRDGAGGAIICWYDYRSGVDADIYAQRLDPDGNALWPLDGVPVCVGAGSQTNPQAVSDGAGGVLVLWQEFIGANDNIYAQRLDADGQLLWPEGGVTVCAEPGLQEKVQLINDGTGGMIVVWEEELLFPDRQVLGQRVDAGGDLVWTAEGWPVSTWNHNQTDPRLVSDGAGGAIIIWEENRSGWHDILAQRVSPNGELIWSSDGMAVCPAQTDKYYAELVADGAGGAIIAWSDNRVVAVSDLWAQRLDASGTALWPAEGVAVKVSSGQQIVRGLVSDGDQGAIIVWHDHVTGSGYFAVRTQRLDPLGTLMWASDGARISTAADDQHAPEAVSDLAGGVIVAWNDDRNGVDTDIYAQQVDADGLLGGPENQPPVAVAEASPTFGYAPLTVNFFSTLSNDPEGQPLDYFWDFGDPGSPSNTSTEADPTHTYLNPGTYTATLTVSDGELTDSAPLTITANSTVSAALVCSPDMGVLPFDCQVTTTMTNQCLQFHRRVAARVDLFLPSGEFISNYKRGFTNLAPSSTYNFSWTEHLSSTEMVGAIHAELFVQDVTPTPYNQPPYPPSGAMTSTGCLVEVVGE